MKNRRRPLALAAVSSQGAATTATSKQQQSLFMSLPTTWTVSGFLLSIGVDGSDVDSAAAALIAAGYKTEKYLLSAKSDHLEKAEVALPVIDVILAHQEEFRQSKILMPALPENLTQEYSQEVWKSVLRIRSDVEGDCATALVFDVHFDDKGAFLYLLTNDHYKLEAGNTYHLEHCTPDNKFLEVDVFDYDEFHMYKLSKESDFVIYKLILDESIWEVGMGIATRKPEQERPPIAKRARRVAVHKPAPLKAPVICKTPQFWYLGINPSDTVRVYALPAASPGRWEANTTITTVDRLSFYLQNLSGPGGSGGAVVTTKTGNVIGYMGGAFDVEELDEAKKKVERRFNSYAFTVHALPRRLSSPPTSPSQDLVAVAGKTER
jgi:hypothetical protein